MELSAATTTAAGRHQPDDTQDQSIAATTTPQSSIQVEPVAPPVAAADLTLTRCTASTLFMDGLHLIYTYLDQPDWLACELVCHHFARACSTDPRRQLSWILTLKMACEATKLAELTSIIEMSERSRINPPQQPSQARRWNYERITRLEFVQWQSIGTLLSFWRCLPQLHEIDVRLDQEQIDLDHVQTLPNSSSLRTLKINFHGKYYPNFIRSLLQSCTACTTIQFTRLDFVNLVHWTTAFHPLGALTQLRDLYINTCTDMGFRWELPFSLPPSLTQLNIDARAECLLVPSMRETLSESDPQPRQYLPNLNHLVCFRSFLNPNKLQQLSLIAPNLHDCDPGEFHLKSDPRTFGAFPSLRSITFREPPCGHDGHFIHENDLIQALAYGRSISELIFYQWTFESAASWTSLGEVDILPQLSSLKFEADHLPRLAYLTPMASKLRQLSCQIYSEEDGSQAGIDHLKELKELEILTIGIETDHAQLFVEEFNSPLICPKLCRLTITSRGHTILIFDADRPIGHGPFYRPNYRRPHQLDQSQVIIQHPHSFNSLVHDRHSASPVFRAPGFIQ